ncbi:calcium-translocating P-type ATPase, PMCA-type [Porphyromonas levii]|uniref:calcium-translocating P-type ATPase, PMCA-type n=1 Tax=Porphyromonas levii TaxID=28114 RepID=UPI001B8C2C67|nr:calcium-translocating P-type ATPase, PMCA-type [Porphyromonas levii]MBR8712794.1 Calcium-transporting ATPase [Porphyromonas levii]MBR8714843.1 Calcium-transporting ATPase [Porphyromonas levii]MBR8727297.1 Calcium-transporting ATPase [Porphyromonas levii]MBR8735662.1 Calcium-transporting ATPase [Porphyromonas levii]MBR8777704.1 Calcium-transporting ATPase [Porphyromonas levii]
MTQKHWSGLTAAQVEESRRLHGNNVLTPVEKESVWKKFFEKFKDPTIIILVVAAVLSLGISLYEVLGHGAGADVFLEPLGIVVAVLLATGLSFYFEQKADKEFAILNKVNDDEPVRVIRDGHTIQVPKRDIVVGDLVVVETGNEIPADATLLDSMSLMVDESTLTGEPIAPKFADTQLYDKETTFPVNHVMRGTKVMEGHGLCEVFAVGDRTENGKVFKAAQIDQSIRTPLNEQLDRLGSLISKLGYSIAILVLIGRLTIYFTSMGSFEWTSFVTSLLQSIMIAVTVVVVSVPEGLPMAVTLSLAYSMQRMLKTNNLVRKMHACETMGATTVICTDKTGTLTENQMRVHGTQFLGLVDQRLTDDEASLLIRENIALNSTATIDETKEGEPKVFGNPTEGALLLWLYQQGVDAQLLRQEVETIQQIPFSTERKYMVTEVHSALGKRIVYVKGAPEIVYALSAHTEGGVSKEYIEEQLLGYQSQAMRTLGFAYQVLEDGEVGIVDGKLVATDLTFLGFVAIADPVRSDVPKAVEGCLNAGIHVKIVTGDTIATAREVARQIHLWTDGDTDAQIITGPEIEAMTDEELEQHIGEVKVVSRARPLDKRRLVEALQRNNQVVAVTGDGTNDAPALKAAHVGLSMGDGTSIAKEASDITIVDNSFSSIGRAVMWGRSLYQNIQRFILFQMTVNVAACLIVLAGAFLGTQSPLTVTQMLWVNLIMDTFAAMALASLPPSERVMKRKPRNRNAFIIDKHMGSIILGVGGLFFVLLLVLLYLFQYAEVTRMSDFLSLEINQDFAELSRYEHSLFFSLFVWMQFWNMFNARAYETGRSAFHFKGASGFVSIALVIVLGQILIVTFGGDMFSVVPLSVEDWIVTLVVTSPILLIGEITRLFKKK